MKTKATLKCTFYLIALLAALGAFVLTGHAAVVKSGTCGAVDPKKGYDGSQVLWTLDDAGTLTISGTGAMADYRTRTDDYYHTYSSAPWGMLSFKNAVIQTGVTNIGNNAFHHCTEMTSVSIPHSVTEIGESAFADCKGLTSVIIPDSVECIRYTAFGGCTGLTSITIPHSVKIFGKSVFANCTGLQYVTIEEGVTEITEHMFVGCTGLTYVTIPNGVKTVGDGAFNDCTGLVYLTVPESVTKFRGVSFIGLEIEDIYFGGSEEQWRYITQFVDIDRFLEEETYHFNHPHWPGDAVKENVVEATCTKNGSYVSVVSCDFCKRELSRKTVIVKAKGHQPVTDSAFSPTCTSDGKTDGSHCSACGAVLKGQTVLNATGHRWGAWTELNGNQHQRVCANDMTHVERANHTWDGDKTAAAVSCTEDGIRTFTCSVCRATKTETIKAAGHQYGAWIQLDDAQHQRVCANNPLHIQTAEHTWDKGTVTKSANCTSAGKIAYTCTVCGATVTVPGEAASGHRWSAWVPFDSESHKRSCANDPTHVETEKHRWDAGTVTKEATDNAKGEKVFTCSVCGAAKSVEIPAIGVKNVPGDVDGNGIVESADARLALRASVALEHYEEGTAEFLSADADHNGIIEAADARLILRASVMLEQLV